MISGTAKPPRVLQVDAQQFRGPRGSNRTADRGTQGVTGHTRGNSDRKLSHNVSNNRFCMPKKIKNKMDSLKKNTNGKYGTKNEAKGISIVEKGKIQI